MNYIALICRVFPIRFREQIIAELAGAGFESFEENEYGFNAYITEEIFEEEMILDRAFMDNPSISFNYTIKKIPEQNWNALWESNFNTVWVHKKCYVRAGFHQPAPEAEYEIVIEPKMSFGTGHHETTRLMSELIFDHEFKNTRVLDMGCGTGILGILALKRGALSVTAIDTDVWACENSEENAGMNNVKMNIIHGNACDIPDAEFDMILANINRNILLNDMEHYNTHLKSKGILMLSGFYLEDLELINLKASQLGMVHQRYITLNEWCASVYHKNNL